MALESHEMSEIMEMYASISVMFSTLPLPASPGASSDGGGCAHLGHDLHLPGHEGSLPPGLQGFLPHTGNYLSHTHYF